MTDVLEDTMRAGPRPGPPQPGDVLGGRYEVKRFIAEGGMGAVYEAFDRELRRTVALKVIHERFAGDENTVERFRREVALGLKVTHPNVCRVYSFDRLKRESGVEVLCLTMELLEGQPLSHRIAEGPLKVAEALPIIGQVAAGLQALHDANIIHRDLKPSNVFLSTSAGALRVVVMDFGIAKDLKAVTQLTLPGEGWVGTPAYMSPEQFASGTLDARTDVYALGAVAFECLTGKLPFTADSPWELAKKVAQDPTPRLMTALQAPRAWESAIHRAMAKTQAERFDSVGDFVKALKGEAVAQAPRTKRRGTVVGLAVCLLAGGLGFEYLRRTPPSGPRVVRVIVSMPDRPAWFLKAGRLMLEEALVQRGVDVSLATDVMPPTMEVTLDIRPQGTALAASLSTGRPGWPAVDVASATGSSLTEVTEKLGPLIARRLSTRVLRDDEPSPFEAEQMRDLGTSSVAAYRLYSKLERYYLKATLVDESIAHQLAEEVIKRDPLFIHAHIIAMATLPYAEAIAKLDSFVIPRETADQVGVAILTTRAPGHPVCDVPVRTEAEMVELVRKHPRDGLLAWCAAQTMMTPTGRTLTLLSNRFRPDLQTLEFNQAMSISSDSELMIEWFERYPAGPQAAISGALALIKQRRLTEAQEVAKWMGQVFGAEDHSAIVIQAALFVVVEEPAMASAALSRVESFDRFLSSYVTEARTIASVQRGRLGDALQNAALEIDALNWKWKRAVERASLLGELGTPTEKHRALEEAAVTYEAFSNHVNAHVAAYRFQLFLARSTGKDCPSPNGPTGLTVGTVDDYLRMVTRMQALAGCVSCDEAIARGVGDLDSNTSIVEYARCALVVKKPDLAIRALLPYTTFHVDFLEHRTLELATFHTHLARFWLAKTYEAAGDVENAVYWYKRFSGLLADADRPIPQLLEARAALERLSPEKANKP